MKEIILKSYFLEFIIFVLKYKIMQRISWIQSGDSFRRVEGEINNVEKLGPGIYELELVPFTGWVLNKTGENFTFSYKIYGLQSSFIEYILETYNKTQGNFGVLFNGTKGSGKSVSAKVLANLLNLPVIIMRNMGDQNDSMISYLASLNFDCVLFFDEFEKQFSDCDSCLLQIMDGVYTSEYRKIFLLTTNELSINPNLLSRPSRVRYVRQFDNLEKEIVEEIINDTLNDLSVKNELMDYIDTLEISTIDILKAIIEEVNIHGFAKFDEFKKSFNVQNATYTYHIVCGHIDTSNINYKMADFIEELNRYKNRYNIRKQLEFELSLAKTEEEQDIIRDKLDNCEHTIAYFEYDMIDEVEKPWNKFQEGDHFDGNIVMGVDIKNKVIVSKRYGTIYYSYIENPDAKPSIYGKKSYSYIL